MANENYESSSFNSFTGNLVNIDYLVKKFEYKDLKGLTRAVVELKKKQPDDKTIEYRYVLINTGDLSSKEEVKGSKHKDKNFIYNLHKIPESNIKSVIVLRDEISCDLLMEELGKECDFILLITFFQNHQNFSKDSFSELIRITKNKEIFIFTSEDKDEKQFHKSIIESLGNNLNIKTIPLVIDEEFKSKKSRELIKYYDFVIENIKNYIATTCKIQIPEKENNDSDDFSEYSERTDEEIKNLFEKKFYGKAIFCYDLSSNWFLYDEENGIWKEDSENRILDKFKKVVVGYYKQKIKKKEASKIDIKRFLNNGRPLSLLNYQDKHFPFRKSKLDLNTSKELLPCKGGVTIDLTGEDYIIRKSCPLDYNTISVGTHYDEKAECPNWMKFLDDCHPSKEVQILLQEICGSALTGKKHFERIFFNLGDGANGKSIFISILKELLGEFSIAGDSSISEVMSSPPMDSIGRLENKRLVFTQESSKGKNLNESTLKNLTGNDTVVGKLLYKNTKEMKVNFTLMLYGNHLPKFDKSYSIDRRFVIIPWEVTFDKKNPKTIPGIDLKERLLGELPGILNWCLEGWRRIKGNKWDFTIPEMVQKRFDDIISHEHIVQSFINDCLEYIPPSKKINKKKNFRNSEVIYEKFEKYCKDNFGKCSINKSEFRDYVLSSKIFHESKEMKIEEYRESDKVLGYLYINLKKEEKGNKEE